MYLEYIKKTSSIALHVRRGDFVDLKRTQNTIAGYQDEMNASLLITDFECENDTVTAYVFGDDVPLVDLTYRLMIIE